MQQVQMPQEEEQTWFFLVPLLNLPYPVYQALMTALNNAVSSSKRMLKLISYVRNHFPVENLNLTTGMNGTRRFSCDWSHFWLTHYESKYGVSELELHCRWPERLPFLNWYAKEGPLGLGQRPEGFSEYPQSSRINGLAISLTRKEFFDRFHKYIAAQSNIN